MSKRKFEPNLQNTLIRTKLGREIRDAFIAQTPDYVTVEADYTELELRIHREMSLKQRELSTSPCIGCGYCCTKAPCMVALMHYNYDIDACPALEWDGKRHWCQLAREVPGAAEKLSVGAGCCSGLNSWRREPLQDRRPDADR